MTWDPLTRHALELLACGHNLYAGDHIGTGLAGSPEQLQRHAERLTGVTAGDGMGAVAPANLRMAAGLQHTGVADAELAAVLTAARAEHTLGRQGTRRVLDDAHGDFMPAADTPLGRQEALRRMAARLRQQRRHLHRSHRSSSLLARRLRRLAYLRRRHTRQIRHPSPAGGAPLSAVRYEKAFTPGHVRQRIGAALDHMGISDPAARRNWVRGYETLIARESGGGSSVIGPEPVPVPVGAIQPDGNRLAFARGITQTIPATFAHYHQPGTSINIYDPVANMCASMNYVIHRYGVSLNGENLAALVQQADAHRPPKGY